jgi:hypothetical protein
VGDLGDAVDRVDEMRPDLPITTSTAFPKPFSRDELLTNVRDILQIIRSKA